MVNQKTTVAAPPQSEELFERQNLVAEKWKPVNDKIYQIVSTNEEETLPYYHAALKLLILLNQSEENGQDPYPDPAAKKYFTTDFLPNLCKYLLLNRSYRLPECLKIHDLLLFEAIRYANNRVLVEDNMKLADMLRLVFDMQKLYYKMNSQDENNNMPFGEEVPLDEKLLEWRNSLKVGDLIDAVKVDKFRKKTWSRATVVEVSATSLVVSFLYDKVLNNRLIERTSIEYYPLNTYCDDFEWRENFKPQDRVDVCDTTNVWYPSTVLDSRTLTEDGKEIKEVLIGYRVYDASGEKTDSEGRKYTGWTQKFDEWICAFSPRVQAFKRLAKKYYPAASNITEDMVIEDSSDILYEKENQKKKRYAIIRPLESKSIMLVRMLNYLGELGFYDKILKRISDVNNWCPFDLMSSFVTFLGNVHPLLFRNFALEYIPKLKDAVFQNLLKGPESNVRNFSKEKIESLLSSMDLLLKRAYSLGEKYELIETITLDIALMCFKSDFLEKRIQGLKMLQEITKQIKISKSIRHLTIEYMTQWINNHKIFLELYNGEKSHIQLIQRSSDFLRFMLTEELLSVENLEMIWSGTVKGDPETKLSIYKVLQEVSQYLKNEHAEYLLKRLMDLDPSDLSAEDLDLVHEIARFSIKSENLIKKAAEFLWSMLFQEEKRLTTPQLNDLALNKYCELMKTFDMRDHRVGAILEALGMVKKDKGVLNSLKILKKLIDNFPTREPGTESYTQKTLVEFLCEKHGLVTSTFDNLRLFKEKTRAKTLTLKVPITEAVINEVIQAPYLDEIFERLSFLQFLINILMSTSTAPSTEVESTVAFKFEFLSVLWDLLVVDALIPGEKDILFKWLKDFCESKNASYIQEITKFYKEKVIAQNQEVQEMTREGFNCFKALFCSINVSQGGLLKTSKSSVVSHGGVMIAGKYVASYSNTYDEYKAASANSNEFEYQTAIPPQKLEGEPLLWKVIFDSENKEVLEKAIEFLNSLYMSLSSEMEKQLVQIRADYLNQCTGYLEQFQKAADSPANRTKMLRCLLLLSSLFDESEKKGTGKIKYHSSLIKGELLTFVVNNDLTVGGDVPKKIDVKIHSNKTVFDLRHQIALLAKTSWDSMKLYRFSANNQEIKDNENGRTLQELRIRNGETIQAQRKPTPYVQQVALTNPDGSIVDGAKVIFTEMFDKFAENGKMGPDGCAGFIHSCTNDNCKGDDRRVKEVFEKWDHDHDGFLVLDNFLDFYQLACNERPSVVWYNLQAHHYRNDLKRHSDVEDEAVDVKTLPTYIFSQNPRNNHLMFELLDYGGALAVEAWKMINRLPTSQETLEKIERLEGVSEAGDNTAFWEDLLHTRSNYRLLYNLSIIEYLMEEDEEEELKSPEKEANKDGQKEANKDGKDSNEIKEIINVEKFEKEKLEREAKEEKANKWRAEFILYGGFDHLFTIFKQYSNKDHLTLDLFDKNILSFVLKILKNYLMAALAKKVPCIYKINQFIKMIHFSLDLISDSFKDPKEAAAEQSKLPRSDSLQRSASTIAAATNTQMSRFEERKQALLKQKLEESREFKNLSEKLDGKLGEKILSKLDLLAFLSQIQSLIFDIMVKTQELESEDRLIIEFGMSIVVDILLYDSQSQNKFLAHPQLESFLIEGLFTPKSLNVRKYFSHSFYLLARQKREVFGDFVVQKLLRNLPSSKDSNKKDCNQFYDLVCKLIEEGLRGSSAQEKVDFAVLLNNLIENIRTHQSQEKRANPQNDKILIGYLNLTEKILQIEPSLIAKYPDLATEIMSTCLFDFHSDQHEFQDLKEDNDGSNEADINYVKCKSSDSRRAAYKILVHLTKHSQNNLRTFLETGLIPLLKTVPVQQNWNFMPSLDTKSIYGYVGLRNLGCICYMNAMLQQFFMCQQFRYSFLMVDDKEAPNMKKPPKDKWGDVDDNVVHQLQKMFGYLELSDRQDYNPYEFCFSFKDYTGNPVNVSVQQDTQEFLNMIFEKLETALKKTSFKNILESIFGGKTTTQLICAGGCNKVKSREENFYNLSLEVRNQKTIYDSLEKYITGEIINDYMCEDCNKKVDTTKRCCLSFLPNILIVHLQRIVFNLDTLMNEKINSKLEFPFELNLEPYTVEGIQWREEKKKAEESAKNEDAGVEGENNEKERGPYSHHPKDYYEYTLKGVTVHIGTAEFGHYYSYIKIRDGKWLEFNDSNIRDFDPKNMESECFGGSSSGDGADDGWGWSRGGRDNSKNAYILVYERKIKDPIKLVCEQEAEKEELRSILGAGAVTGNKVELDFYNLKKYIPKRIYKMAWEDNHKFMLERHLYCDDFFKFIKDIVASVKTPNLFYIDNSVPQGNSSIKYMLVYDKWQSIDNNTQELYVSVIKILVKLILEILARAHDNGNIMEIAIQLKNFLSCTPSFVLTFFTTYIVDNFKTIVDLLLLCPDKTVRSVVSSLSAHCVNILINFYDLPLLDTTVELDETRAKVNNVVLDFLNNYLGLLPNEVAKNWNKFQQYFDFWNEFAMGGNKQIAYLYKREMIAVLMDFFLEKRSPLVGFAEKKHPIAGRYTNPPFDALLQVLSILIQRANNKLNPDKPSPYLIFGAPRHDLSENDFKCLSFIEFYERCLKENYDATALSMIITIFGYENRDFCGQIAVILLRGLNRVNYEDSKPYLEVIYYFLSIPDTLLRLRVEWLLGFPQPSLNKFDTFAMTYSLDEVNVDYKSSLNVDCGISYLNVLFQNRRKWENLCMVCLNKFLMLMYRCPEIFDYVMYLPPPSALYAKYTDWFKPFITTFLAESKYGYASVYSTFNKEELANNSLNLYNGLEEKINSYLEKSYLPRDQAYLHSMFPNYLLGRTIKEDKLFEDKIFEKPDSSEVVLLSLFETTLYYTISKPTGETNKAFPESVIKEGAFNCREVDPSSQVFQFIQFRQDESFKPETKGPEKEDEASGIMPIGHDIEEVKFNKNTAKEDADAEELKKKKESQNIIFKGANDDIEAQKPQDKVPVVIELPAQQLTIVNMETPVQQGPLIRRYVVTNNTDQLVTLNMRVFPKAENPKTLFKIPLMISATVKPKSTSQVFALVKLVAEQEWEDLGYEVNVQLTEQKVQQGYSGYDSRNYKDDDYSVGRSIPAPPKLNLKLENAGGSMEMEYGPSYGAAYGPQYPTMRTCSYCTTMNDLQNPKCRKCNKELS